MRYVAIGDSFSEGLGDPNMSGEPRGWADRSAQGLADDTGQPVMYANLAIRGRLLENILGDQLDAALKLDPTPTLISVNGGGNDCMRIGTDISSLTEMYRRALDRIRDAGITPILIASPDPFDRIPLGNTLRRRCADLTDSIAEVGKQFDALLVDTFRRNDLRAPQYWSDDRLHLNAAGHAEVAASFLNQLGATTDNLPMPTHTPPDTRSGDVKYIAQHVVPWIGRRLRRRSSGDSRTAKYADWTRINPLTNDSREYGL